MIISPGGIVNVDTLGIGEVKLTCWVGGEGVSATNFGLDSRRRTLIWRAGFVLCVVENFTARIACGTVSIGAIFSNDAASEPTSDNTPLQKTWWGCRKVEVPWSCYGKLERYLQSNTAIDVRDEERLCVMSPSHTPMNTLTLYKHRSIIYQNARKKKICMTM